MPTYLNKRFLGSRTFLTEPPAARRPRGLLNWPVRDANQATESIIRTFDRRFTAEQRATMTDKTEKDETLLASRSMCRDRRVGKMEN